MALVDPGPMASGPMSLEDPGTAMEFEPEDVLPCDSTSSSSSAGSSSADDHDHPSVPFTVQPFDQNPSAAEQERRQMCATPRLDLRHERTNRRYARWAEAYKTPLEGARLHAIHVFREKTRREARDARPYRRGRDGVLSDLLSKIAQRATRRRKRREERDTIREATTFDKGYHPERQARREARDRERDARRAARVIEAVVGLGIDPKCQDPIPIDPALLDPTYPVPAMRDMSLEAPTLHVPAPDVYVQSVAVPALPASLPAPAVLTQLVLPPKRGPGRPKGSKNKRKVITGLPSLMPKRPRGRPKGSKNKPKPGAGSGSGAGGPGGAPNTPGTPGAASSGVPGLGTFNPTFGQQPTTPHNPTPYMAAPGTSQAPPSMPQGTGGGDPGGSNGGGNPGGNSNQGTGGGGPGGNGGAGNPGGSSNQGTGGGNNGGNNGAGNPGGNNNQGAGDGNSEEDNRETGDGNSEEEDDQEIVVGNPADPGDPGNGGGSAGAQQQGPRRPGIVQGGWEDISPGIHERTVDLYNRILTQTPWFQQISDELRQEIRAAFPYVANLTPEQRDEIERRLIEFLDSAQEEDDETVRVNHGQDNKKPSITVHPASPVAREDAATLQSLECNRCAQLSPEEREANPCNLFFTSPRECSNCTEWRYNMDNGASMWERLNHDCLEIVEAPGHPMIATERRRPVRNDNQDAVVTSFLDPWLWQCDQCASEGRYCDADGLMSVKCTTCESLHRDCRMRNSKLLRARDFTRTLERGFRIMCRLCCKQGKLCSWTSSTEGYGSGATCDECTAMHDARHPERDACTTFSRRAPTGAGSIWTPLPTPNVLPSLDSSLELTFIRQRVPWRCVIAAPEHAKWRPDGNGKKIVLPHHAPEPTAGGESPRRPSRFSCELCYQTNTECFVRSEKDLACKTCGLLGMKCIDRPILDPDTNLLMHPPRVPRSHWNLGNSLGNRSRGTAWSGYKRCEQCRANRRQCDRKRPCESCLGHGVACDLYQHGMGTFPADRHPGDRGGNYYLGMGFGLTGLNTPAVMHDPTRLLCGIRTPLAVRRVVEEPVVAEHNAMMARHEHRETILNEIYGNDYQEPGSGWLPGILAVEGDAVDPTEPAAWPGSYIRNDREPRESFADPTAQIHPPGIATYTAAVASIGGGDAPGPQDPPQPGPDPHPVAQPQLAPAPLPLNQNAQPGAPLQTDQAYQQPVQNAQQQDLVMADAAGEVHNQGAVDQGPDAMVQDDFYQEFGDLVHIPSDEDDGDAGPLLQVNQGLIHSDPPDQEAQGQDQAHAGELDVMDIDEESDADALSGHSEPGNDPLDLFGLGDRYVDVRRFLVGNPLEESLSEPEGVTSADGNPNRDIAPRSPWTQPPPPTGGEDPRIQALERIINPVKDVLADIPSNPSIVNFWTKRCNDLRAPGFEQCQVDRTQGRCENLRHPQAGSNGPHFSVCEDCDRASKRHIWSKDNGGLGISAKEILNMRAYLCGACSERAESPEAWAGTGYVVYGLTEDKGPHCPGKDGEGNRVGRGRWLSTHEITGCDCAEKLMGRQLCSFHRLHSAQQMIRQAAMMQEWRFRRYGRKVCPMCQNASGLDCPREENSSQGIPRFYNCLVCCGMVRTEERDSMRVINVDAYARMWYGGDLGGTLGDMAGVGHPTSAWAEDFAVEEAI